ncbi:CPCC family cysteine-rich protein [Paenibacillus solisilvae]|uniref:CPCC family cysteine-rich protein n=1 Tax=Paenibacillus solisilvae TaxID=2486751 RepID=A0ABW0W7M9_9BACL
MLAEPLVEGQKNYVQYGACEKEATQFVRKPKDDKRRDPDWKP